MCIINSAKWKSALRWRASNDEFGERTPLKLLISQMPGLFASVFYDTIIVKLHTYVYSVIIKHNNIHTLIHI